MADVKSEMVKTKKKIDRLENTVDAKEKDLKAVKDAIADSNKDLKELLDQRNQDHKEFVRALQMDAEAVTLIESAVVRLSKYYKENNIPLGLMQAPEYSEDPDKAPETTFSGADAHKSESGGIVAILEMIKEDLQKEMN